MHVLTRYQPAGLSKRLKAFALDYLVISGYMVVLAVTTSSLFIISNSMGLAIAWPADPVKADLLAFVMLVLPVTLYFALQESSSSQATWGKRKVGIRVTGSGGKILSGKQALIRSSIKFLPWQIAHSSLFHIAGWPIAPTGPTPLVIGGFLLVWILVFLYIGAMLLTRNHRTPYDWVAGAYVVVN